MGDLRCRNPACRAETQEGRSGTEREDSRAQTVGLGRMPKKGHSNTLKLGWESHGDGWQRCLLVLRRLGLERFANKLWGLTFPRNQDKTLKILFTLCLK